jgi:ppGpp synthetase/RelA/SpoT-type nucleotidyltranferase
MVDQTNVPDGDVITSDETDDVNAAAHEARLKYEIELDRYEKFTRSIAEVLKECLEERHIKTQSISYRAKNPDEFERKAARPMPGSITAKYSDPLAQITDKAGVRVITYFLRSVGEVADIIDDEFEVIENAVKASEEPDRFGYTSLHFLVKYRVSRSRLTEYRKFTGLVAEIQVRTVLQHAWAEIEHDIQYKSPSALPRTISRRFASLAGLIEIADREFQAIEKEQRELNEDVRRNLVDGRLDVIEITPDALQAYLDEKYGPDGRMRDWSYEWTSKLLLRLGFTDLAQVDESIRNYDDDLISRKLYDSRMGQLTRLEAVVLASMGDYFIRAHPWARNPDLRGYMLGQLRQLEKLQVAGVPVGTYQPPEYPEDALSAAELAAMRQELAQKS